VITDINGKIAYRHEIQTGMPEGRVQVLKRVFQCVHKAITAAKLGRHEILESALPFGVIDTERGLVLSFPRPGQMAEWKNVPLQAIFEEEFNMPCLLEDSVRTMATAERYFGLGQQVDDFLFVEVGMGIGASLIFGGNSTGAAAEMPANSDISRWMRMDRCVHAATVGAWRALPPAGNHPGWADCDRTRSGFQNSRFVVGRFEPDQYRSDCASGGRE